MVRTSASDESVAAEPKEDREWDIVSFSSKPSISNVEVPQSQAIAIIPSLLMVSVGKHTMPLRDWLLMPPDEMKLETLLDITSKSCDVEA